MCGNHMDGRASLAKDRDGGGARFRLEILLKNNRNGGCDGVCRTDVFTRGDVTAVRAAIATHSVERSTEDVVQAIAAGPERSQIKSGPLEGSWRCESWCHGAGFLVREVNDRRP